MKDFFSIIALCFFLFIGCTKVEPKYAEGEFNGHFYKEPIETNTDKVSVELIHKSTDFKLYKVVINDTVVSYFAYEYHTGFVKLN